MSLVSLSVILALYYLVLNKNSVLWYRPPPLSTQGLWLSVCFPGLSAPALPSCFHYSALTLTYTSPLSCCPVNLFPWFILNNDSATDLPACCPLHLAPAASALGATQAPQSLDISPQIISLGSTFSF